MRSVKRSVGDSRDSDIPTLLSRTVQYGTRENSSENQQKGWGGRRFTGAVRTRFIFAASHPKSLQKGRFANFLSPYTFLYLINIIHAGRRAL
jgi:hypothetical protein